MSERSEFLVFAALPGVNFSELCRRFRISRQTGYKLLQRHRCAGLSAAEVVADLSRRPHCSPRSTPAEIEALVLGLRARHPYHGGRKLRRLLQAEGLAAPPAPSTITAILRRHDLLSAGRRLVRDTQRFECAAANELWQMDFKGHFPVGKGRCHPLTVLDDHSRFNICLAACPDEQGSTVRERLIPVFQRYGLPERMLMDNGSPWGASGQGIHTRFSAWLIRLGISISHGRPYHPQTQGKEERFHRTLKLEVLSQRPVWHSQAEMQAAFDRWREHYNQRRPHEALDLEPPVTRYRPSPRRFPSLLPPIEYGPDFEVRRVGENGRLKLKKHTYFIGKAFAHEPAGLRQVGDGVWEVYYCHQKIITLNLSQPSPNSDDV